VNIDFHAVLCEICVHFTHGVTYFLQYFTIFYQHKNGQSDSVIMAHRQLNHHFSQTLLSGGNYKCNITNDNGGCRW